MTGWHRSIAIAGALTLALASSAGAELRRLQAVGAVPIDPGAQNAAPRDDALDAALREVVLRVAHELVPDLDPLASVAVLGEALGTQPLDYVSRFRILEDRGERRALFTADPTVEREYVVMIEAQVDVDRVRARLSEAGLFLGSSADELPMRIRMVLEDLQSYGSYASLRRSLLNGVGVRSVVPIELERGRAVLEVDADQGPAELLDALLKAAPPTLQILPIRANGHTLVLYVAELAPEPEEIEGFDPGDDEPAGSWMPGVGAYDRGRGKRAPGVRRRPPRD